MLSLEEELQLSDDLVARNKVRKKYCDLNNITKGQVTEDMLSVKDKKIWRQGAKSAHILVNFYLPLIRTIAKNVSQQYGINYNTSPSVEDLVQEGVIAAYSCTWAFNLRGSIEGQMGKRFSSYASQHIKKNMRRTVMKNKTPFKIDVDSIQTSWAWRSTTNTLKETLGREPTDEEVKSKLFFKPVGTNEQYLPMRGSLIDVDDHETGGANLIKSDKDIFVPHDAIKEYGLQVYEAVKEASSVEVAQDAVVFFGLDRNYSRDVAECASFWEITNIKAKNRIWEVLAVVSHPAYRVKIKNLLSQYEDQEEL